MKKLPWKAGASSGHITNLKQSILKTFDIYGLMQKQQSATKFARIILMIFVVLYYFI